MKNITTASKLLVILSLSAGCSGSGDFLNSNTALFKDADADGYGDINSPKNFNTSTLVLDANGNGQLTDGDGIIYVVNSDDCDDASADVFPDASEVPSDGIDNDCDGTVDEEESNGNLTGNADEDADGFDTSEDCDDANAAIHPEADEICVNSIDENCDGVADDGCDTDTDLDGAFDYLDEDDDNDGLKDDVDLCDLKSSEWKMEYIQYKSVPTLLSSNPCGSAMGKSYQITSLNTDETYSKVCISELDLDSDNSVSEREIAEFVANKVNDGKLMLHVFTQVNEWDLINLDIFQAVNGSDYLSVIDDLVATAEEDNLSEIYGIYQLDNNADGVGNECDFISTLPTKDDDLSANSPVIDGKLDSIELFPNGDGFKTKAPKVGIETIPSPFEKK